MLKIYRSREDTDKEKFIYKAIATAKPCGTGTLVIVPDQYTLDAEKRAMNCMNTDVLLDVEITTFSRLGSRLLREAGKQPTAVIDKYGRQMLLTGIISGLDGELEVFGGLSQKEAFIETVNDFISQAKQYSCGPEELAAAAAGGSDGMLSMKLRDLQRIYAEYEKATEGCYTDSEDIIDMYISMTAGSAFIASSRIWIYGFDSFTPKNVAFIAALSAAAVETDVYLTYDEGSGDDELFTLTGIVTKALIEAANGAGADVSVCRASGEPCVRAPGIRTLEKELYRISPEPADDCSGITVVRAANMYNEAQSAASYVLHLLRDEGYRMSDIVLICNDQDHRMSMISRAFEEYGIGIFGDFKRPIAASKAAVFIVALLEALGSGCATNDVMRVIKTGFAGLDADETDMLENYVTKYRIKGSMWKKPFVRGAFEYGEEGLQRIEALRSRFMELFSPFENVYERKQTCGEFLRSFYELLVKIGLPEKIAWTAQAQEAGGFVDMAEETMQVWSMIMDAFSQMAQIMGSEPFRGAQFTEMLLSGLTHMEVGVIPPTADDIMLGTMQRTRSAAVKALIVIGANEGMLPLDAGESPLFSSEELEAVQAVGSSFGKTDDIRIMEEQLAIYRNLSKPSEHLWISYSVRDEEGAELRPSEIIDRLLTIFPDLTPIDDVVSQGIPEFMIGGRVNTVRQYTVAMRRAKKGGKIAPEWKAVGEWLSENDSEAYGGIRRALDFDNRQRPLGSDLVRKLFGRGADDADSSASDRDAVRADDPQRDTNIRYEFSPSRIEAFSRCPFSHFVSYALRPDEQREYTIAGREIGDLYHLVLMRISERLTKERTWQTVTTDELKAHISEVIEEEAEQYRDGVFTYTDGDKYWKVRAQSTCFYVCTALVSHVRRGAIKSTDFEVPFGPSGKLPPIRVETGSGTVLIKGKIDRVDTLRDDRIKIIDYKTGNEKFDRTEAEKGYRLQLMLYLNAAAGEDGKPAGVFYFNIADPNTDLTGVEPDKISSTISKNMENFFKLNGIMLDSADVIKEIAGDFEGRSPVIPVRTNVDGRIGTDIRDFLISEDEFAELRSRINSVTQSLCLEMLDGRIDIRPKKSGMSKPCTYCRYKGICMFNTAFAGCTYDVVK